MLQIPRLLVIRIRMTGLGQGSHTVVRQCKSDPIMMGTSWFVKSIVARKEVWNQSNHYSWKIWMKVPSQTNPCQVAGLGLHPLLLGWVDGQYLARKPGQRERPRLWAGLREKDGTWIEKDIHQTQTRADTCPVRGQGLMAKLTGMIRAAPKSDNIAEPSAETSTFDAASPNSPMSEDSPKLISN